MRSQTMLLNNLVVYFEDKSLRMINHFVVDVKRSSQ